MCTRTIYDARNNFSALVKLTEGGEPDELTRHDKPVAVTISYEDFKMIKPKESFVQKMMELREKYADVLAGGRMKKNKPNSAIVEKMEKENNGFQK